MEVDFVLHFKGPYSLLDAKTEAARDWCEENLHWTVEQLEGKYAIDRGDDYDIIRGIIDANLDICDIDDIDLDQERH